MSKKDKLKNIETLDDAQLRAVSFSTEFSDDGSSSYWWSSSDGSSDDGSSDDGSSDYWWSSSDGSSDSGSEWNPYDWYLPNGNGSSQSDCLPNADYEDFLNRGYSMKGLWVCGYGYISVPETTILGSSDDRSSDDRSSDASNWESESSDYDGSSDDESGWFGCPDDECQKDEDCGYGSGETGAGVCHKFNCGPFNLSSYRKCREMTIWEKACEGSNGGDTCYVTEWKGHMIVTKEGTCQTYGVPRYVCSLLNATPGGV